MGKALDDTEFQPVKVLGKAFALLEHLHGREQQFARLNQLAAAAGLPKPTAYRLLRTLEELGFLEHEAATETYRPTDKLRHLGCPNAAGVPPDLTRAAMTRLVAEFEQTVNLAVVGGGRLIYRDVVEGLRAVRMRPSPGVFLNWEKTALGKSVLAFLPRPAAAAHGGGQTWARLAHVRAASYAIDLEESEPGLCCVGAPIFDRDGSPIAALSISGGSGVMTPKRMPLIGRRLIDECRSISLALGWPERSATAAGDDA